ncbi:50S ribosomal protein L13 [Facklamia languida]|uniref:Large ribosomal subunit protein uL13 n=1 Tax=Facklamia languida CCUG 37842 TaxID=883113 RepID=H3NIV1_9LACT|nr:ribosomal protein L13 [Facklamia languida CCUG 37842]
MRQTYMAKKNEVERNWVLLDATDVPLGRLSAAVASILRGKNKPTYTPHVDTGDFVIVINAEKVALTGKKVTDKKYYDYSGHPGGMRVTTAGEMRDKKPTRLIERSVKGMLPDNRLGRKQFTKLFVYVGSEHQHAAQQPQAIDINTII